MTLTLECRTESTLPIDLDGLLPETLREQSLLDIARQPVWQGRSQIPLGDLFHITGNPADERWDLTGRLASVHRLGQGMSRGSIRVVGPIGRHLGAQMRDGTIDVEGSAGDFCGAEMKGGRIHVHGSAGDFTASAYRGSPKGMTGGTILVEGSIGRESGHSLRRGLLAVGGDSGEFLGANLIAGTILVGGRCGLRAGAGMRRGSIILLGPPLDPLLPTFTPDGLVQLSFLPLYFRQLSRWGWNWPESWSHADFASFTGDRLTVGRGEILMRV